MRRHGIVGLLIVLLAAGSLNARVFMRWGAGTGQTVRPDELGWAAATTEESLTINGQSVTVQTLAAPGSSSLVLDRLRGMYEQRGAVTAVFPDTEMGWGLAVWPDRVTGMLVLSPRALTRSLVFLVHQGPSTGGAERQLALPGIPDYPDARIGSTVRREEGADVRFLYTQAGPREILAYYDDALGRAGWQPFFTDAVGRRADAPLAVYTKGERICMVSISTSQSAAPEQIVTVLVKD